MYPSPWDPVCCKGVLGSSWSSPRRSTVSSPGRCSHSPPTAGTRLHRRGRGSWHCPSNGPAAGRPADVDTRGSALYRCRALATGALVGKRSALTAEQTWFVGFGEAPTGWPGRVSGCRRRIRMRPGFGGRRVGYPSGQRSRRKEHLVIILGVILILLGALLDIGILYTLGGILAVVGVILWLLGAFGRQVGPRAHYY